MFYSEYQMWKEPYFAECAVEAMRQMSTSAQLNGVSELSLKEINKEIAMAREEKTDQK